MDRLKEKAGPLPIWAWAALGIGVIVLFWYLQKSGALSGLGGGGSSSAAPAGSSGGGVSGLGGLGIGAFPPMAALGTRGGVGPGLGGLPTISQQNQGAGAQWTPGQFQHGAGDPHGPPDFRGPNRGVGQL